MKKVIESAVLMATKAVYPVEVLTTKAAFLEDAELVEKIVADCKKAVADYVKNKKALREFMRRSPAWNVLLHRLRKIIKSQKKFIRLGVGFMRTAKLQENF